jgi:hypothetical protein
MHVVLENRANAHSKKYPDYFFGGTESEQERLLDQAAAFEKQAESILEADRRWLG